MEKLVLISCQMDISFIDGIKELGFEPLEYINIPDEEFEQILPTILGIIVNTSITLDAERIHQAKKLKFIARAGSGMENIDEEFALKNGISCFNSPEGNRDAVGEHALGMLLSLFSNIVVGDQEVRAGIWHREENRGIELNRKTIGIIGYGNTGSAFAEKLSGLGVKIKVFDKYKTGFANSMIEECTMDEIYNSADVISLHIPLSAETKGLVNQAFINKCSKSVTIINTSRGGIVDLEDLVAGIKNGKITGACLDVLEDEPLTTDAISKQEKYSYLVHSPKVILSPHVAGWTHESKVKIGDILLQKIRSVTAVS